MNTSCVYIKTPTILYFKVVDFSWVLGSGSNLDKDGFWPIRVKYLLHQPAKGKSEENMGSVPGITDFHELLAAYLDIPKVHSLRNASCFTIDFAIYSQAPCLFEIESCGLGIEELSSPLFLENHLFRRPLILADLQ